MIGTLQGVSSDPNVEKSLDHELLVACNKLSEKYRDSCHELVIQLAPQIENIARAIPSTFICSHLGVCPKYRHRFELLTSENCSKGSKFWCSSTTNAALCGPAAIEYCQQHVWKATKPIKANISNI